MYVPFPVWSWKLSRTKQLTAASSTAIDNAMANIDVVENRYFQSIDQSDQACFYLPEIAAGQPVIFPGQCDTTITGVNNFSPSRVSILTCSKSMIKIQRNTILRNILISLYQ